MNDILANRVPELMAAGGFVTAAFIGFHRLIKLVINAMNDLNDRHEETQKIVQSEMTALVKETNKAHVDTMMKTHEVIIKNTVQSAQTQVVLDKVLEKLK